MYAFNTPLLLPEKCGYVGLDDAPVAKFRAGAGRGEKGGKGGGGAGWRGVEQEDGREREERGG